MRTSGVASAAGRFRSWWSDSSGQDLIEYGLLATLVSLGAVLAVESVGLSVGQLWARIAMQLAAMFQ